MPVVRVALGLALAYAVLALLAWLFQDRLAFPAPRGAVPDPQRLGIANGERIELTLHKRDQARRVVPAGEWGGPRRRCARPALVLRQR